MAAMAAAAALRSSVHFGSLPASTASRSRSRGRSSVVALRATQAPTVTVSSQEEKVQRLWTWLRENGVAGGAVRPASVPERLGLVAEKSVGEGEEVLAVPSALWINAATARASGEVGRLCEGKKPWIAIALFLLHEKSVPNSKWRPYLDALPDELDSPLFWSDEELAELQGSQLMTSALGYKEYVESEYKALKEELQKSNSGLKDITFNDLVWTFGMLRSRSFAPLTGDDLALVPFADLVNHGSGLKERSSWEKKSAGFFSQQSLLAVRSGSSCRTGEQVLIQYGQDKSNAQLALDYGFVERDTGLNGTPSTSRDKFTLTLEIPESDRFLDDKLDICQVNKRESTMYYDLVAGEGPSEDMLTFLRLTVLGGADAFHLEALFRNAVWEHLQYPISRENEEAICRSILEGCSTALSGYSTSVQEDVDLLNSGSLSSRREIAVVVRLGEKRVLRELQTWFEERLANLDKLEYYAERRLKDLGLVDDRGYETPWLPPDAILTLGTTMRRVSPQMGEWACRRLRFVLAIMRDPCKTEEPKELPVNSIFASTEGEGDRYTVSERIRRR